MKLRLLPGLVLLSVCSLSACGSGDSDTPDSPIVGTWQQVGYETRIGSGAWSQPTDGDCRLDNVEEYSDDGSWVLYDGPNQCGAGTGIVRGVFRLAASDTKVIYTYDEYAGEYEATLESLTDTELVLTFSTGDTKGTQVRNTYRKK